MATFDPNNAIVKVRIDVNGCRHEVCMRENEYKPGDEKIDDFMLLESHAVSEVVAEAVQNLVEMWEENSDIEKVLARNILAHDHHVNGNSISGFAEMFLGFSKRLDCVLFNFGGEIRS